MQTAPVSPAADRDPIPAAVPHEHLLSLLLTSSADGQVTDTSGFGSAALPPVGRG